MITKKDLQEAIAKCNGKVDPKPDDALLMAACMIIQDHMQVAREDAQTEINGYSNAASTPVEQKSENTIQIDSGTEFSQAIGGLSQENGWAIMDELMETLRVINPRLYGGVIRKIKG